MNQNQYNWSNSYQQQPTQNFNPNYQDDRLIGGGFAFPFLLGGVTGAALAPNFFGGYNRPFYNNYYYYPYPPRPYPPRPYPPRPPYPRPY